jgi:hypothetical protein
MRQCLLQRGHRQQVAWIPSQYAVKGNYLLLHDQNGWQVKQVYPIYLESVSVPHGYFTGGVFHR